MVHVLSSRILLRPTDPERSRRFYGQTLGLPVYREFGTGPERGTVYFLGGGFLEVSGRSEAPAATGPELWLQVADADAALALSEVGLRLITPCSDALERARRCQDQHAPGRAAA